MILPTKHIPTQDSLLGIGAIILRHLQEPRTVTSIWEDLRDIPNVGTFDRFTLALSLLFSLGTIELRGGRLRRLQ